MGGGELATDRFNPIEPKQKRGGREPSPSPRL